MNPVIIESGHQLVVLPEEQWKDQLTEAQETTWILLHRLSQIVTRATTERKICHALGLQTPLPFRSRVEHMVKKGALAVIQPV